MASRKKLARDWARRERANGGVPPTEDRIEDRLAVADELTAEAERLGLYDDEGE